MAMLLTEIDHVAIAVGDLEAAIAFYERAFGATVTHREVVESDGVEEALLRVADSYVQLVTPTRPDSPVARFLEKRGDGLHHVGYRVDDCAEAYDAMTAAGIKFTWHEFNAQHAFLRDEGARYDPELALLSYRMVADHFRRVLANGAAGQ